MNVAAGHEARIEVALVESGLVADISFERGEHNFLSFGFLHELSTGVETAAREGARAAVIRTPGRRFCAGADFRRPASGVVGPSIYDIVPRLLSWPIPVVAAVGGAAVGGGFGLALVADFRVASERAYFLANFGRLGITPGFAMTLTLPALIGRQRAADVLYSSRRVDAEESHRIGLVDRLVRGDRLVAEAHELASQIAYSAPAAVSSLRRDLWGARLDGLTETLAREREEQEALMRRDDFREGVAAWREKRLPDFGS